MVVMVLVTIPSEKAEGLAEILLKEKVCACVNIVEGVKSLFWWKGKITTAKESLLIIKTRKSLFPKLKENIKNNYPYDVHYSNLVFLLMMIYPQFHQISTL